MKPLAVSIGIAASCAALACCGVSRQGEAVRFTGQTNLVVWDQDRGIEHFVRDARFAADGADLGFIAPTPGRPTLAAVDPHLFATLEAMKPEEEATASAETISTSIGGKVEVVESKDVAGYRATVLKARDGESLRGWLSQNGYAAPPFLNKWVTPYVQKGWYLTAFKVNGDATGPVRMSFDTDRPFNPYSVPQENGGERASLRLYYVSAGREVPLVGGHDAWREPKWSVPLDSDKAASIADAMYLTPDRIPDHARMTVYQDNDFGHPGLDDLYFVPDPTPMRVAGGAGAGCLVIALAFVRRLWRTAQLGKGSFEPR